MQSHAPARQGDAVTPAEWRDFGARLLHAAGLGSLGAGVIFFVAANWQAWGLAGRFGLLEAGLLACVATALRWPPPARVGQGALLLATLFVGALLALFGQSYQTGADAYELFFTWALLALPFAVAAASGAVWASWWVVLDVALALVCSRSSFGRSVWFLLDGWGANRAAWLMVPCLANLLGAAAFLALERTRLAEAAPPWLARFLLTVGLGFGTVAALPWLWDDGGAVVVLYVLIAAGIGVATWARRRDVFPLTVLSGSLIVTSTAWLAHSMHGDDDLGKLFVIALWLIGSSTAASMLLMRCLRTWRTADGTGVQR